jgi:hypothetical protein
MVRSRGRSEITVIAAMVMVSVLLAAVMTG